MSLKKLLTYWVLTIIFVLPLFVFPWVRNFTFSGKNIFLWFFVLMGFLIWAGSLIADKRDKINFSFYDGIFLLFSVLGLLSLIMFPAGVRVRALTQPDALGTFVALFLFSFLFSQTGLVKKPKLVLTIVSISAAISVFISAIFFLLPASSYPLKIGNLLTITGSRWSTMGSIFELTLFALPLSVYWIQRSVREIGRSKSGESIKTIIFSVIFLIGLGVSGYQLLKAKPVLLDYSSSWSIAAESFKQKPLTGVGLSNFNTAFSLYRPVEFNNTDNWALRFDRPNSFLLHLWTETGIIGMGLWLLVAVSLWKVGKKNKKLAYPLLVIFLTQIFLPSNISMLFLYFIFISLLKPLKEVKLPEWIWVSRTVAGMVFLFTICLGFFFSIYLVGEMTFVRSLRAVSENRGGDAYQLQTKAITTNRYLIDYRVSRSQTDFALANAIASKEDITDEERQQVSLLIQESIDEAKAAAALEPRNVYAWENLAQLYRQIINLAEGADQWTISAYQQAIALDPVSPNLRVGLGGVYYALGNYAQASRVFEAAVQIKPDFSNGWYNWAWALKQQGQLFDAVQALQQAVGLIESGSADHDKSSSELEEWKKELGEAVEQQKVQEEPSVLTEPEPIPTSNQEPIELSPEAAPEIQPESPASE